MPSLQGRTCLLLAGVIVLCGGVGCSSPTEPPEPPTVFVLNPLCDASGCQTLQVRAFISKFHVPQQPTGLKLIGEISGSEGCLAFPASWKLVVTGSKSVTLTSTMKDPIYIAAVESETLEIVGFTEDFVPGDRDGAESKQGRPIAPLVRSHDPDLNGFGEGAQRPRDREPPLRFTLRREIEFRAYRCLRECV